MSTTGNNSNATNKSSEYDKYSKSEAFRRARAAGLKTFRWRGGVYGTKLKSEVTLPSKVGVSTVGLPNLLLKKRLVGRNRTNALGTKAVHSETTLYVDRFGNKMNPQQYYEMLATELGVGNNIPKGMTYDLAIKSLENRYQATIMGHTTNIKDNSAGYIPVETNFKTPYNVVQNYNTGEYYATRKQDGEVVGSSPDPEALNDPNRWTRYHTGWNGDTALSQDSFDNNRGARIAASDALDRGNQAVREHNNAVDNYMSESFNKGKQKGLNVISYPMLAAGHAIWGSLARQGDLLAATYQGSQAAYYRMRARNAALRGDSETEKMYNLLADNSSLKSKNNLDYVTSGYFKGFMPSAYGNKNTISGFGQVLDHYGAFNGIEDPYLRQSAVFAGDLGGNMTLSAAGSNATSTSGVKNLNSLSSFTGRVRAGRPGAGQVRFVTGPGETADVATVFRGAGTENGGTATVTTSKGNIFNVSSRTANELPYGFTYQDQTPRIYVRQPSSLYPGLQPVKGINVTPNFTNNSMFYSNQYLYPTAVSNYENVQGGSFPLMGRGVSDSSVTYTGTNGLPNFMVDGVATTGEAGVDARQRGNMSVNYSDGTVNDLRSVGRKSSMTDNTTSGIDRKGYSNM